MKTREQELTIRREWRVFNEHKTLFLMSLRLRLRSRLRQCGVVLIFAYPGLIPHPGKPGLVNGLGYNIPRLTALVPSRVKDLHGFRLHL